ncbi:Glutamyl aminopeptidase [Acropora cervicornis]|uniref:Aminopeptidase n=1 Tax=Acropora cervicornis TaxID=6130 RepID=A0AAD9V8Q3_ACRCE|nr:Glutamyl aminopeptidase [Acropora cervicornis]
MTDNMEKEVVPLHFEEPDGEQKKAGKWAFCDDLFSNKMKLIAIVILIFILVIIIIVLAAVLGHERSKHRGEIKVSKEGKDKEQGPTRGPTRGPTLVVRPTTLGTGPWSQVRLPDNIKPSHYNIILSIDLTKPNFNGTVSIWIKISIITSYILLHTSNMNVTLVEVKKESGGESGSGNLLVSNLTPHRTAKRLMNKLEVDQTQRIIPHLTLLFISREWSFFSLEQIPVKRYFDFDKNQFLVIELESPLDQGTYITTVEYSGKYSADLRGLYKSSYRNKNGVESAFPCFDEPALKATFNVTIVHNPKLISLSNMPLYQTYEKEGFKYDRFEKSVKMSTYLVAFFVGDFKFKETETDRGVKIRIYSREEVLDQVDYALEVTNQTMMYFEKFFGVPYSLSKSGGMENWGLIKYKERLVLLREGITSESITTLVAHEVGHQWFGNIVTMDWWTDLWLNEGFASYVSAVATQHIRPEWHSIPQFIVKYVFNSLDVDGLQSSHAVRIPVIDPQKILEIFDIISYRKGGSILFMLHNFLGDEIFRGGVKRYLTKHAFGNAETKDLWDAMTEAIQAAGKTTNIRKMMNTFILQMGYPVVTVTKSSKPNTYVASQSRFLYYQPPTTQKRSVGSPHNYKWVIPFSYFSGPLKTSNPPSNTAMKIIEGDSVEFSWNGGDWIKGNIGQTGFYRVNYEIGNWKILTTQLKYNHKIFNDTDRAGLIDDSYNLARANLLNHTIPLSLSVYLTKEEDYIPLLTAMAELKQIIKIVPSTRPVYPYLQKFIKYLTKEQFDKLGMEDTGDHFTWMKRGLILESNCLAGGASCLRNITRMFNQWMNDPIKNAVPPHLKYLVYYVGVMRGGEAEYLKYSLDLSKTDKSYLTSAFYHVADNNAVGTNVVWNFLQLNFDRISNLFGSPQVTLKTFIPHVSSRFSTDYQLKQLEDSVKRVMKDETPLWTVNQAIERVKINIQWRKSHETDVFNWLKGFFNAKQPDLSHSK